MTKKTIRSVKELIQHKFITAEEETILQPVVANFSLAITDQVHQLIDKTDSEDPIGKQFIPDKQELVTSDKEYGDPIGDEIYTTVKGIIHRYPDRCLLLPANVCPVYCRFCFRREKINASMKKLTSEELEAAFNYIREHPEIWEVIITGGDPLILKPETIQKIFKELHSIPHVEVIRIHTRVPVVDSKRINQTMINALSSSKPLYIILHANHPREFTPEAISACASIVNAGIPMLSQSVLLKDLNDNIETLSELMRCFIKNRIKPFYLHHADLARGTAHFRTTIAHGQNLVKQLRGRFSGLCQPTYVLDIPGGYGKIPIGPGYLKEAEVEGQYLLEDYLGQSHEYP